MLIMILANIQSLGWSMVYSTVITEAQFFKWFVQSFYSSILVTEPSVAARGTTAALGILSNQQVHHSPQLYLVFPTPKHTHRFLSFLALGNRSGETCQRAPKAECRPTCFTLQARLPRARRWGGCFPAGQPSGHKWNSGRGLFHVHLLVVMLHCSFARCHSRGKTGCTGSLCIISSNCSWLCNYLRIKRLIINK